jgi:hypothetical protein
MEQIWCDRLMNIGTWKSMGEWLQRPWLRGERIERLLTTTSGRIPYSSQTMPGSNVSKRKSALSCVRRWAELSSKLLGRASHLHSHISVDLKQKRSELFTLDTSYWRLQITIPVPDSQRCKAQSRRPLDENAHQGTERHQEMSWQVWGVRRCKQDMRDIVDDKSVDIRQMFAPVDQLETKWMYPECQWTI